MTHIKTLVRTPTSLWMGQAHKRHMHIPYPYALVSQALQHAPRHKWTSITTHAKAAKVKGEEQTTSLEELRQVRITKIEELRKLASVDGNQLSHPKAPFAYKFDRTHLAANLQSMYKDLGAGEDAEDGNSVAVCGRVMARRVFGKLAFVTIEDVSGRIQLQVCSIFI